MILLFICYKEGEVSEVVYAFVKKENVPSSIEWQKAIDEITFDVNIKIDPTLKPFEDDAFIPFTWNDVEEGFGFEIYYGPLKGFFGEEDDKRTEIIEKEEKDFVIAMGYGSKTEDFVITLISAAALLKSCNAIVLFEGEDEQVSFDYLVNNAKHAAEELQLEKVLEKIRDGEKTYWVTWGNKRLLLAPPNKEWSGIGSAIAATIEGYRKILFSGKDSNGFVYEREMQKPSTIDEKWIKAIILEECDN